MPALNLPFQVIFIAYINIWPTEKEYFLHVSLKEMKQNNNSPLAYNSICVC